MQSEVPEDALDCRRFEDGGDDLQQPIAVQAVLKVDLETPLEQSGPAEARGLAVLQDCAAPVPGGSALVVIKSDLVNRCRQPSRRALSCKARNSE